MTNKLITLAIIILCACSYTQTMHAQNTVDLDVQTTFMQKIGHIPPISELPKRNITSQKTKQKWKKNRKILENFAGRDGSNVIIPALEHQGPDKLRQTSIPETTRFSGGEPLINMDGITSNSSPNDPTGDIGADHYFQSVNATRIGIYDKEGNLQDQFLANEFWGSIGFSSAGDPIVLYDQEVDRWIFTEFPFGNQLLVAVSDSSDPLGSWTAYNFGTPSFPDYPKWAVWTNAYTVTTNEQGPNRQHFYVINKEQLLNGEDQVDIQRLEVEGTNNSEQGFIVSTPVDWSGKTAPPEGTGPLFVKLNDSSWGEVPEDAIDVFEVDIDWDNPANTAIDRLIVPTSPYDSYPCALNGPGFACIPQPNGATGLDGIPEVIMYQVQYRNFGAYETMVMSFVTDVTDGENLAGVRWVEMRKSQGSDWDVYQEGTVGLEDGLNRYMSTIAMDGGGNIGLAYSVSSETEPAGVRYTARLSSDPLGMMTLPEVTAVDGGGSINTGGRFGDYAHMSVDPVNDNVFWFTTEYAGTGGQVNTRIVAFQMQIDSLDIGPFAGVSPVSSSTLGNENLVVEIQNFGVFPVSNFSVSYAVDGGAEVVDEVNVNIASGDTYQHTFSQPIDMNAPGVYPITITTQMDGDQNANNNTIVYIVEKLPAHDIEITNIDFNTEISCGPEATAFIAFKNNGDLDLTSATFNVNQNANLLSPINWTGSLMRGETDILEVPLTGLLDGTNQIEVQAIDPNGENDEVPSNNQGSGSVEALLESVTLVVDLFTDGFPEETTWELVDDATGIVVAEGGPYDQENEHYIYEVCVDPEACLTMTIFDSYGDGVNSFFDDDGDYTITDIDGNVLASLISVDFGEEESNFFCLGDVECDVQADIVVTDASSPSAEDGSILINVTNGFAPFMYSIDGGNNFSEDNLFTDLASQNYELVILDSENCIYEENVTVGEASSIDEALNGVNINIAPNPTDGELSIIMEGLNYDDLFLAYSVFDVQGQQIQNSQLVKYDNSYQGMLSLTAYPSGQYYIRFNHPQLQRLIKVIRQ